MEKNILESFQPNIMERLGKVYWRDKSYRAAFEREKEAASRATTLPVVGESLWKYYGKLQMTANNY